jgi:hypothetical protein
LSFVGGEGGLVVGDVLVALVVAGVVALLVDGGTGVLDPGGSG